MATQQPVISPSFLLRIVPILHQGLQSKLLSLNLKPPKPNHLLQVHLPSEVTCQRNELVGMITSQL